MVAPKKTTETTKKATPKKEKAPAKARAPRKVKTPKENEEMPATAVTSGETAEMEAPASVKTEGFVGRYVYAVGRRKTAAAQVRLYPVAENSKEFIVNKKTARAYFGTEALENTSFSPLKIVGKENDFAVSVLVRGGGLHGQAGAIKLGIARALIEHDAGLRAVLKAQGFLTRDSRAVERKKPGLKKARRAPQWAKR